MNGITRNLLAPDDGNWSIVHGKLGCFGCKFANRAKLDTEYCCTHPQGVLVDMNLKCDRRSNAHHKK